MAEADECRATNGYSFIMNDYIVNGQEYSEGTVEADEVGVKAVDDQTLEVQLKKSDTIFHKPVYNGNVLPCK